MIILDEVILVRKYLRIAGYFTSISSKIKTISVSDCPFVKFSWSLRPTEFRSPKGSFPFTIDLLLRFAAPDLIKMKLLFLFEDGNVIEATLHNLIIERKSRPDYLGFTDLFASLLPGKRVKNTEHRWKKTQWHIGHCIFG